jgi:hypothetical protein
LNAEAKKGVDKKMARASQIETRAKSHAPGNLPTRMTHFRLTLIPHNRIPEYQL